MDEFIWSSIKCYEMSFSKVYPHYLAKVEKKCRSQDELHKIVTWLTGYSETHLQEALNHQRSFKMFIETAPALNPHRRLITGSICGVRVEEITEPLMQEIRYLDKMVDELAKGKPITSIMRKPAAER